jgi:hypothetical protein
VTRRRWRRAAAATARSRAAPAISGGCGAAPRSGRSRRGRPVSAHRIPARVSALWARGFLARGSPRR